MLEDPNKEELDEQEIINKCVSGAKYEIVKRRGFPSFENTHETIFSSRIITDLSETFEVDVEEIVSKELRKLFLIEGFQELLVYQNAYSQIYSEKTGEHPKSIILKNCFFKNKTEPMEFPLKDQIIFDNCKLELTSNKHGNLGISVKALINSDIVIKSNIGELTIIEQVRDCVFSANPSLAFASKGAKFVKAPEIISTIFLSQHVTFLNPFILKICKLNSVSAHHAISLQSSLISERLILESDIKLLEIEDSTVGTLVGSNVKFAGLADFEKVRFLKPPMLEGCSLESSHVVFNDCVFDDKSSTTAQGAFRQLKSICEKAGYEHGAIDFHALELETYYNLKFSGGKCPKGLKPEKIAHIFHKAFTDYGRDLTRPFVWLAVIFATNLIITFFSYYDLYSAPCGAFLKALKFSINGLFAPLSFALPYSLSARELHYLEPSMLASIVNAIQAVLSSLIWFLIIFMIRRRFKM